MNCTSRTAAFQTILVLATLLASCTPDVLENAQALDLESVRARYDGEIAFADSLFDEELLVPLIVKPPGFNEGLRVVDEVVELVDIAPTILEYAAIEPNPRFQGISLVNVPDDGSLDARLGYAQLRLEQLDLRGVRSEEYKYVFNAKTDSASFFNLKTDPREQSPIAEPFPEPAAAFADYARTRATSDTSGFHLLITDINGSNRPIECAVSISGMKDYELRNLGGAIADRREGDTVLINGRMKFPIDRHWGAVARINNYVHLHVQVESASAEAAITFTSDGAPPGPPTRQAGEDATSFPIDGTAFSLADLIATPDRYTIATLPEEYALYAWYVPPVGIIRDEDLPPGVLERLEALGYVR